MCHIPTQSAIIPTPLKADPSKHINSHQGVLPKNLLNTVSIWIRYMYNTVAL